VNISVRPKGQKELGAKIEIKNMNSFSGVRKALEYEIPRQIEVVSKGGKLSQETRRWDDVAGITETMRSKEQAHDYRYFPEPDLMPFEPTEPWLAEVSARVVELPLARKRRFMGDYQLPASDAQTFVWDVPLGKYFERAIAGAKNPKGVANWVINNLRAKITETQTALAEVKVKPAHLPELVALVDEGKISSKIAQEVFAEMFTSGEAPGEIVAKKGLAQVSDTGAIEKFCDEVIAGNPKSAEDFRAGRVAALNFLQGEGESEPGGGNFGKEVEGVSCVPVANANENSHQAGEINGAGESVQSGGEGWGFAFLRGADSAGSRDGEGCGGGHQGSDGAGVGKCEGNPGRPAVEFCGRDQMHGVFDEFSGFRGNERGLREIFHG
jgi:Glu-tRNA(Gln) amidotransferase subunit E-like FAD-binding protein